MAEKERQQTGAPVQGAPCFKHIDSPDSGYKAASQGVVGMSSYKRS